MTWLLGWDDQSVDPELRKAFEVSLHAGTAVALLIALRAELAGLELRELWLIGLAAVAPAVAGYLVERPVERYLGTPPAIAGGLVAGALALGVADRERPHRSFADAGAADAGWLGVAQALALFPGVSRSGATLAAARARGFARPDAHRLARHTGLPVIAGATLLKTVRLARRGLAGGMPMRLAAGAGAAFTSTLVAARRLPLIDDDRPLWPYCAYRIALAALVLERLRNRTSGRCSTMRA